MNAEKINKGLLVRRLVLGRSKLKSTALSDQALSASAIICRRLKKGILASELLWQYTAAALEHMEEVTGMPMAATIDAPTLAAFRHPSLV